MTVAITITVLLGIAAALIVAGSRKLESKAETWERYERWIHPPDDDDGVSILEEDDDDADSR